MFCRHIISTFAIVAGIGCALLGEAVAQQVGTSISADGGLPNTNAMLDIQSPATGDGKGLLIPRVTQAQRAQTDPLVEGGLLDSGGALRGGPAHGLLVYQTDGLQGFYYNTSASDVPSWLRVGTGDGDGDFMANGSVPMSGRLNMQGNAITNADCLSFDDNCVEVGNGAQSYSSLQGSVAVGRGATARYRISGLALGAEADGDYNGIAIGYQSDGQYSNIAIGFQANAYSGYDRITIGRAITNRFNNSVALRGTLYLDGGTGVLYRPIVGSGTWQAKAFTIDHPLDPENKVLRHFCIEGPQVWNYYAGNAQLTNGEAVVDLPDYYTTLNLVGSEVYSLTPIGAPAALYIKKEVDNNRFIVGGDVDIKFSWTVNTLRNDPGCLEDIKRRPAEQWKRDINF
ncbi:MAG: hypothetical protein EOM20_19315 [Spartobacteria bacterium]|nr:hypothetical protein [Spartobacteria bacterium]